jgi:hypothetical protein
MNKLKKGCVGLLLALTMIASNTPAVLAANTADMTFDFDVNALNFNVKTGARSKTNSTPVYCYITSLEDNSCVKVKALGYVNSSTTANKTLNGTTNTIVDYVTCKQGTQYSIHTSVYESGYSKCQLAFCSQNTVMPERVVGVWSPDSAGTYADAWK